MRVAPVRPEDDKDPEGNLRGLGLHPGQIRLPQVPVRPEDYYGVEATHMADASGPDHEGQEDDYSKANAIPGRSMSTKVRPEEEADRRRRKKSGSVTTHPPSPPRVTATWKRATQKRGQECKGVGSVFPMRKAKLICINTLIGFI